MADGSAVSDDLRDRIKTVSDATNLTVDTGEKINAGATAKIASDEDYAALPQGTKFVDPEGKVRVKPYEVKDDKDYDAVPWGERFMDPEGKTREKPKAEGLDLTAQTLYDMSVNDKERANALARSYGRDAVKQNGSTGQFYVEKDGKFYAPGQGSLLKRGAAEIGADAAPVVGSVVGAIGGGAGGSVVPGAGTTAGVIAGGAAGGAAGQGFNDMILGLTGVYDRSGGEEAKNIGIAAATGGAGPAIGRAVSAVKPLLKGGAEVAGRVLPKAAAYVLGADPAATATARQLADKGVLVPPSAWAKEAPHIQNVVEVFDPAFHTQKPLQQSAEAYYERGGSQVLKDLGVDKPPSLVDPNAAVSTEKAGTAVLSKVRENMAREDANLRTKLDQAKATASQGITEKSADHARALTELRQAEENSRRAAQEAIDVGFQSIQGDIDKAVKATGSGTNSGDLWGAVGEKLKAVKQGIQGRAGLMYNQADELAGPYLPNTTGLSEQAKNLLDSLPEDFQSKYPDIVRKISELGQDGGHPTFGQLHNLRSILRSNVNYYDLTPDIRQGTFKYFSSKLNEVLHDKSAGPALRAAADQLDRADAYYAKNMKAFNDKNIQTVVSGLESGMPADPKNLFDTLVKEGRTDLANKVRKLVGPNLWAGVKAADVQDMMDASKTLIPGQIDGRAFAKQVLDRHRNNMLEAVHGKEASEKLIRQAQNIEMLNGKLDIAARPGDTVTDLIQKARVAAEEAKAAAKADPLGTLNSEMKKIEREHNIEVGKLRAERRSGPLAFLYNPSTGASEAADRILGSEDLIFAASDKFGENSPEFNLLRQTWAQKVLQGTLNPASRLEKISPEVQQIMFPGVTLKQMQTLAKEMSFLGNTKASNAGLSMSATSKVEHPWGAIAGGGTVGNVLALPAKVIPGSDAIGRFMLGAYYKMIRTLATKPALLRWVEKGLDSGSISHQQVQAMIQNAMKVGGPVGAGVGEAAGQEMEHE